VKQGQIINGYLVVSRPSNANAGKCVWAFAEKDGEEYFIKEFLDPKRPRPDSMGSVEDKKRRYAECQRFERRHQKLIRMLPADDLHAGNLVLARDFFAEGTRYYKVSARIHGEDITPAELAPHQQLVLLRTLADSLQLLHGRGIVHGDLRPDNVMLHRPRGSDLYTAKLIDFDDAYPAGEPPARDQIGGSPLYGAPEWLRYLRGDTAVTPAALTQAVDMFAFGLLVHTYLFGVLPRHDHAYESPASAVIDRAPLAWHQGLDPALTRLLTALTDADPLKRPDITETAHILAGLTPFVATSAQPSRVRINVDGRKSSAAGSRLRVNVTGRKP